MKSDIRIFKDFEILSRHAANIFVEQAAAIYHGNEVAF
jgi:hypothetical protein